MQEDLSKHLRDASRKSYLVLSETYQDVLQMGIQVAGADLGGGEGGSTSVV